MIDFLFDNPIIIGFVIYFVWMMLKPSKAEKKNIPNRPVSRPNQDEEQESTPPYYESRDNTQIEPKVEQRVEKKVPLTQSNSADTRGFDYAKEKQRLEERKKKAEAALKKLNQSSVNAPTHAASSVNISRERTVKPTKQQLREGVLWAEILSKPKARR